MEGTDTRHDTKLSRDKHMEKHGTCGRRRVVRPEIRLASLLHDWKCCRFTANTSCDMMLLPIFSLQLVKLREYWLINEKQQQQQQQPQQRKSFCEIATADAAHSIDYFIRKLHFMNFINLSSLVSLLPLPLLRDCVAVAFTHRVAHFANQIEVN